MSTDIDWQHELDSSFGTGNDVPPGHYVAAGRTAVVRRRRATAVVLAAYCVVMVLPALVLMAARVAAGRLVEPLLDRLNAGMTKNAASTTAWVVGIVGFLLARDAVVWLGWMG